jgi:hypothetical protein
MTPIIFLDFDGVIAHSRCKTHNGIIDHFSPNCVKRVIRLAEEAGARIVVHSTWVHVDSKEHILERMTEANQYFTAYLHPDWVCNDSRDKSVAVAIWLLNHPDVKEYLVIDDERIGKHPQVLISAGQFKGGIQDYHVQEGLKIFGIEV